MDHDDGDHPHYRDHRQRHPCKRMADLKSPVLLDVAQESGYEHDGG